MLVIFIRTLVIFLTLEVVMRLMGKRQIGEMQSFELVITLIIADLACVPMADVSIPLTYGIVSILALFLMHQILSLLGLLGEKTKRLVSGRPSVVINKRGIDFTELKKNNMDVDDLLEAMRGLGYFSLADVDYALFESNGKLSALEKADGKKGRSLPVLLVAGGKPVKGNLALIKKDEAWLNALLQEKKTELKDVGAFTVDGDGNTYLQTLTCAYTQFAVDLGDVKW